MSESVRRADAIDDAPDRGGGGGAQPAQARPGLEADVVVQRDPFTLDVRVSVASGEVVAVLGPNGSGKSTLLRALAGLTPISSGRVTLAGQVLDEPAARVFVPAWERPVGVVFQDGRLFPHLSVLDNVAFGHRVRGANRSEARVAAQAWLERFDLGALASRRPGTLSGGQAQRVALARALAARPALLLLDEPLAALDIRTRMSVQAELRSHLADFAGPCVLVTHDPMEALVLADRLVVVEAGRLVQQGSPEEVTRRPATDYVAALVGLNLYEGYANGAEVALPGGGVLTVPDHDQRGQVLVAMRPSSIVIHTRAPEGMSARNAWPGVISGLTILSDRVRVEVDARPPLIADVTPAAVAALGLRPGLAIWASIKATEIDVYAPSGG